MTIRSAAQPAVDNGEDVSGHVDEDEVGVVEEGVDDDDDDDDDVSGVKLCPLGDLSIADFNDLIADDPEDVLCAEVPEQLSVRAGQRSPLQQQQQQQQQDQSSQHHHLASASQLPPPPPPPPRQSLPPPAQSSTSPATTESNRMPVGSTMQSCSVTQQQQPQQHLMLSMVVDADESNSSAPPLSNLLGVGGGVGSSSGVAVPVADGVGSVSGGAAGTAAAAGNKCMRPKRKSQRPVKLDQESVDGGGGGNSSLPLSASAGPAAASAGIEPATSLTIASAAASSTDSTVANAVNAAAGFSFDDEDEEEDDAELACPVCLAEQQPAFSTWSAYLSHLAGHGTVGGASCRACRGTFANRATLLAHECLSASASLPGHRLARAGYFVGRSCPICLRHFEERARFINHSKRAHKAKGAASRGVVAAGSTSRCALCHNSERVFQSADELSTHLRMAHNKFACSLCCKPVATEAALQAHLKAIHANAVSRCQHCALVFGLERELRDHVALKHSLRCPHCGLAVQKKGQLLSHLRLAHGIRRLPGLVGVSGGPKSISSAAAVAASAFHCSVCARSFASRQALQLHKQQKHSSLALGVGGQEKQKHRRSKQQRQQQKQPRRCPVCAKVFRASSSLHRHQKLHQSPENRRSHACPHCPYATHDPTNYARHLIRHTDQRRYACPQCPKRFLCKKSLSDHLLFKHSETRSFPCEQCGAAFKTRGTLLRHLREHGPPALRKRHQCDLCGNRFVRLYNLKRHCAYAHKTNDGAGANDGDQIAQLSVPQLLVVEESVAAAAAADAAEDAAAKSILDSLVSAAPIGMSSADIDCKPVAVSTTLSALTVDHLQPQHHQHQQQSAGIWRPAAAVSQPPPESAASSGIRPTNPSQHQQQPHHHQSLLDEILWGNPSMSSGSAHVVDCCQPASVIVTSSASQHHHHAHQQQHHQQ
uniref:Zinc finger and BTB domain-containing protein 48 n=1 Tax=Macrostomum lignano TaxID=282301 RepID=A0A1I8FZX7_9PLAT